MRAPRFPLHMAVRFRRLGDPGWRKGQTENISRSGILIRSKDALPVQADVELRLALPPEKGGGVSPPEVFCRGRVVRTVSPSRAQLAPAAAVVIENYDFMPAQAVQEGSSYDDVGPVS
jgi:hypothetical protein